MKLRLRDPWTSRKIVRRQRLIYDRLWRNFQRYPHTVDGRHDTEEWKASGEFFAACVIHLSDPLVTDSLEELTSQLDGIDGVRVHPTHFRHIMLQELGSVVADTEARDEISPERLDELSRSAGSELANAPAYTLSLGRVNAFQDSIILEVEDDGQTAKLHSRLNELATIPTRSPYAYLPHMTIAHFAARLPTSEVVPILKPWRKPGICELTVSKIEIVTLDMTCEYPELQTYSKIPLEG